MFSVFVFIKYRNDSLNICVFNKVFGLDVD